MQFLLNDQMIVAFRLFCIGKNYSEHVRELGSNPPDDPVVFMKPPSNIVSPAEPLVYPPHGTELHHEVETVVLIGKEGRNIRDEDALSYIAGVSLGLDLTLRDVQKKLKQRGLPWELSKSFEQSAPLAPFTVYNPHTIDLENFSFSCSVNGELRQEGNTRDMIFPVKQLIQALSRWWALKRGDIIFTGTPAGLGLLKVGDRVTIAGEPIGSFSWKVVPSEGS